MKKIIPLGCGLIVTISSLMTMGPGLPWLDAGDFVTASASLGVPHATGFPVYTMLGHLAIYLPLGNLAFRISFLSALLAGVTVFGLVELLRPYVVNSAELLAVGLSLILVSFSSPALFLSSRVPEVYSFSTAMAALGLLCLDRYRFSHDARWLFGLSLSISLGLANHALFRLWMVVFLGFAWQLESARKRTLVLSAAAILLAGLLTYLYLPVAASRKPVHNWGDPSTVSRFYDHVTGAEIQESFAQQMSPNLFVWKAHLAVYLGQLWSTMGVLMILGFVGLLTCIFLFVRGGDLRNRFCFLGVESACLVFLESVYAVAINPMGLKDLQNGQLSTLLVVLSGTLLLTRIVFRMAYLLRPSIKKAVIVTAAIAPALSLVPLSTHGYFGLAGDWSLEDMAIIHTSSASPASITTLVSDSVIASQLYVHVALDARPDLAIFGRNRITNGRRFAYTARKQPFQILDDDILERWEQNEQSTTERQYSDRIKQILNAQKNKRPIYWEVTTAYTDLPDDSHLKHAWPVGLLISPGDYKEASPCQPQNRGFCSELASVPYSRDPGIFERTGSKHYKYWLADQWGYAGRELLKKGDVKQAMGAFEKAWTLAPDRSAWKTNIAVCLAAAGQPQKALRLIAEVLETDPLSRIAVKNGLLYSRSIGDRQMEAKLREHAAHLGVHFSVSSK